MVKERRSNWFSNFWPSLILGVAALCASVPALQQPQRAQAGHPLAAYTPTPTAELPKIGFGVDQTPVESPAQDSTGDIWAIKPWTADAFFKWNGTKWARQSFEPAKGFSPVALQRVQDGAVLCVWQHIQNNDPTKDFLLSEHNGNTSRILSRWEGSEGGWIRLFRSPHTTWITFWGTQIYRVENSTATRAYDIKDSQLHTGIPSSPSVWLGNNPLEMLEDARGHMWFWSNEFEWGFNDLSLRGLLEFDGQKWIHHAHIQGLPDKPLTAFVERDSNTFWLAVGDGGLFELDAKMLKAKKVPAPLPRAFEQVQTIRHVANSWYLIANAPEVISPGSDFSQHQSDVWRWQAPSATIPGGSFKRVLRGLDYGGAFSDRPNRPILTTKTGLWLGALSGGAWWLPFDQKLPPVHIDWRQGLLLADVNALFQQNDGRLLATARSGTVRDLLPYLAVASAKTPQTFTVYNSVLEDARHHLWRVPNLKGRVVQEWDGAHWTSYPLPAAYRLSSLFYLSTDAQRRIWLLPDSKDGPTAVLTPSSHSWQFFPTFLQALQNQLKVFGATRITRLGIGRGKYQVPRTFAPNKLAFRSPQDELCFFDGQKWRAWMLKDIVGEKEVNSAEWEGTPYFDAVGTLCANIDDKTWQWSRATDWKAHEFTPYPFAIPEPPDPPKYGPRSPEVTIRDSSGAIWMLKNRQLWKAAWGLCEPQLAPSEQHPLRDGRKLTGVSLDARGVPLLGTGTDWHYEYVWSGYLPPNTRLSVTPQSQDTFNLRFIALPQNREKHWFRWRLDGGEWSKPQIDSTILLSIWTAGKHRVEVAAINSHLQLDASPATTTLTVPRLSNQQLAHFLSMLTSPNYNEREKAVKAFSRQPASSIPFLQTARRNADANLQWWIDAALQESERHTKPLANRNEDSQARGASDSSSFNGNPFR